MSAKQYILCPGQGAQVVGMGKALCEKHPGVRVWYERASAVLGYDLAAVCFDGPEEKLNGTDVCQPALFVTGVAAFHAAKAAGKIEGGSGGGEMVFAGLSLGEYTALHLGGAVGFEDGVRLVARRGFLMQQAATATPSGMVALIGADEAKAQELCTAAAGGQVLSLANFNAPGQIVASGNLGACERLVTVAGEAGIKAVALKVAGAFHSALMQPAADAMKLELEKATLNKPSAPVYSNVTAALHTEPGEIKALLVKQIVAPVKWQQTMEGILAAEPEAKMIELSPGRTLTGLVKKINRRLAVVSLDEALLA